MFTKKLLTLVLVGTLTGMLLVPASPAKADYRDLIAGALIGAMGATMFHHRTYVVRPRSRAVHSSTRNRAVYLSTRKRVAPTGGAGSTVSTKSKDPFAGTATPEGFAKPVLNK